MPIPQWRGIVSALASGLGVCLALGPVFPEVAHKGPSLNWSGGRVCVHISLGSSLRPLTFVIFGIRYIILYLCRV